MTTTTVLDGCSMSKGIERLGGDQEQRCVALAGRSEEQAWLDEDQEQQCVVLAGGPEEQAWLDGDQEQQCVALAGRSERSEEQAWLDEDQWQQCVALAGRSEQEGWQWKYPASERVGRRLKRVVVRREGDEELDESRRPGT